MLMIPSLTSCLSLSPRILHDRVVKPLITSVLFPGFLQKFNRSIVSVSTLQELFSFPVLFFLLTDFILDDLPLVLGLDPWSSLFITKPLLADISYIS